MQCTKQPPEVIPLHPHGRAVVDRDALPAIRAIPAIGTRGQRWKINTATLYRPRAFAWVKNKGSTWPCPVQMERLCCDWEAGTFIRHRNGNTLDCRRANLELVGDKLGTFRADHEQRESWDVAAAAGIATPDRLPIEAWRLWCQGREVPQVADLLRATVKDTADALSRMWADPLASEVPVSNRAD